MTNEIKIGIRGTCGLLQHRMPIDKVSIDAMKALTKVLQKNPDNEEAYTKEAALGVYKNDKEILCIPSTHIEGALVKSGVEERVAGKGKKTYKDYMKAFILIEPDMIPINPQKYEIDRKFVIIQRARILRTRPLFKSGWEAIFNMTILDDTIPVDTVRDILIRAGSYVGIGDWRPKFGRFEVIKFEEVKRK